MWNGRREGRRGDVVEIGWGVETPVTGASAKSATPPNDWFVVATTRRPIHSLGALPARSTTPHTSMPSVKGIWPMTLATVPRQRAMSPKLSEAAETAMRTSPGPGSGIGMSETSSASAGSPCLTTRTAFTAVRLVSRGAYVNEVRARSWRRRPSRPDSRRTARARAAVDRAACAARAAARGPRSPAG